MSTTEVTTWAVDLSTVGAIYPFAGWEFLMFIMGLIFWISFHVWQLRAENRTYEEDLAKLKKPDDIIAALKSGKIE